MVVSNSQPSSCISERYVFLFSMSLNFSVLFKAYKALFLFVILCLTSYSMLFVLFILLPKYANLFTIYVVIFNSPVLPWSSHFSFHPFRFWDFYFQVDFNSFFLLLSLVNLANGEWETIVSVVLCILYNTFNATFCRWQRLHCGILCLWFKFNSTLK